MPDLTALAERAEREVMAPDFASLVAVSRRRRGRRVATTAIAAAAALATTVTVWTGGAERRDTLPADRQTQTLSLEDRRRMADMMGNPDATVARVVAPKDPRTTAEVWTDCRTHYGPGLCATTLRVTSGGASSDYLLPSSTGLAVIEHLKDDLFWYDDRGNVANGIHFVVDASGTAPRPIAWGEMSPSISRSAAGWDVVDCGPFVPCRVDLDAGVFAPLDIGGPGVSVRIDAQHGIAWSSSHDPLLWGVTQRGQEVEDGTPFTFEAIWFTTEGVGRLHTLATNHTGTTSLAEGGPAGLLAFYVADATADGTTSIQLHTSANQGRTWQVRRVPASALDASRNRTLPDEWESWPLA